RYLDATQLHTIHLEPFSTRRSSDLTWGSDNKTLFYTRKDEKTLRADRIYRHTLGTDPITDELVFTEEDETFGTYVYKTKSREFIDRKSTRLNSSHVKISYAVFCLKK